MGQVEGWLKGGSELPVVIVVHSKGHHAGVVGIVASRLVEIFHRPTFVLAGDEKAGMCHGVGRGRSVGLRCMRRLRYARASLNFRRRTCHGRGREAADGESRKRFGCA